MHPILKSYFNAIKRFIPKETVSTAIGLDLGSGQCKMVGIAKGSDGFELTRCVIRQINDDEKINVLKEILGNVSSDETSVISSVSGKGTLIRYIEMPRMKLEDLRQSFAIEAEKYFPFAQDQIYTDCFILNSDITKKQMPVMVAAAKKEMIDERIQLMSDLDAKVSFVGLNPIALANAFYALEDHTKFPSDKGVGLLDFGEAVSNLTILVDKLPRFTRDVFIGGRDFTKRISNALGVSMDEAEKLKCAENPSDEVVSSYESAILNIVQELKLSFNYFTTEKNIEVNQLLITGGASILKGLPEALSEQLGIEVIPWDPLKLLKISPEIDQEEIKNKGPRLGVALGLALYNYA